MPGLLLQFFHVISNLEIKKNGHDCKKKKKKLNFSCNLCLMSVKMSHEVVVFDLLWSL